MFSQPSCHVSRRLEHLLALAARYIIMYWTNDNFLCRKYLLGDALRTPFKYVKLTSVVIFGLAFVLTDKPGMCRFVKVEGAV
jgi:hypothetical protein